MVIHHHQQFPWARTVLAHGFLRNDEPHGINRGTPTSSSLIDARMFHWPFQGHIIYGNHWKPPHIPSGKQTQLWKITIFNEKIHYILPFSIAMLNYQRVYLRVSPTQGSIKVLFFLGPKHIFPSLIIRVPGYGMSKDSDSQAHWMVD